MIDFIKCIADKISIPQELEFHRTVSEQTGEQLNYKIAEIDNMKLKVYDSGLIIVSGSIHKYMNQGRHNSNDFQATTCKMP